MSPAAAGRGRVAGASCLGMLAVGANGTAIMAALPTMRRDLGLGPAELEWAVNAYLLASAACIILGGKAADRLGARLVAVAGLVLFALASGLIAAANGPLALLAGRTLQGLGAALAVPGTLAALSAAAAPERRSAAIGAWAGALMLGFSLGPLIGGALTHAFSWRALFCANALALLAAAAILASAGALRPAPPGRLWRGFDGLGFLALATGMVALIFALRGLGRASAAPFAFAAPLAVAGASLALFRRIERHRADPLVDLRLLAVPDFRRAVGTGVVAMFCILPLLLYFNLDAQAPHGLGLSPIGAGLALLPLSAGLFGLSLLGPRLAERFGPRRVVGAAMLGIAAACAGLAAASAAHALAGLGLGLFVIGAGLALPYATAPRLALAALPAAQGGQGSGLVNACTFLGGSLGITLGGLAYGAGGFPAVTALIGAAALVGAGLARHLPAWSRAPVSPAALAGTGRNP
ncbi:MFS transporter [Methylobacterium soli]|uniref:MFS transporter n=1 Tax=Methylobacterium soli TaxID=553447 RepID=A0A6L3TB10_9HYPH|nr:MFS transporter [Methylobacterium soli]KAB1081164.1 MFS transporter [Methylobacterium soli]GJE43918.1 Antiseptic resistance protein [Methylobacterium soli]